MNDAYLASLVAVVVNLLITMLVVVVVDKVGRKPLLIVGATLMSAGMISLGLIVGSGVNGLRVLAAVCLFMSGFAISFGPIVWLLLTEIYPAQIKGKAMSIAVAAQWAANLIVSGTFPLLLRFDGPDKDGVQGTPFFLYGLCALIAALATIRFVPEIRGLSAEQIAMLWKRTGQGGNKEVPTQ